MEYTYPFLEEVPCQVEYQSGLGNLQILEDAQMAMLITISTRCKQGCEDEVTTNLHMDYRPL
jgi:hypothetical protein